MLQDDVVYHPQLLERLVMASTMQRPGHVIMGRSHLDASAISSKTGKWVDIHGDHDVDEVDRKTKSIKEKQSPMYCFNTFSCLVERRMFDDKFNDVEELIGTDLAKVCRTIGDDMWVSSFVKFRKFPMVDVNTAEKEFFESLLERGLLARFLNFKKRGGRYEDRSRGIYEPTTLQTYGLSNVGKFTTMWDWYYTETSTNEDEANENSPFALNSNGEEIILPSWNRLKESSTIGQENGCNFPIEEVSEEAEVLLETNTDAGDPKSEPKIASNALEKYICNQIPPLKSSFEFSILLNNGKSKGTVHLFHRQGADLSNTHVSRRASVEVVEEEGSSTKKGLIKSMSNRFVSNLKSSFVYTNSNVLQLDYGRREMDATAEKFYVLQKRTDWKVLGEKVSGKHRLIDGDGETIASLCNSGIVSLLEKQFVENNAASFEDLQFDFGFGQSRAYSASLLQVLGSATVNERETILKTIAQEEKEGSSSSSTASDASTNPSTISSPIDESVPDRKLVSKIISRKKEPIPIGLHVYFFKNNERLNRKVCREIEVSQKIDFAIGRETAFVKKKDNRNEKSAANNSEKSVTSTNLSHASSNPNSHSSTSISSRSTIPVDSHPNYSPAFFQRHLSIGPVPNTVRLVLLVQDYENRLSSLHAENPYWKRFREFFKPDTTFVLRCHDLEYDGKNDDDRNFSEIKKSEADISANGEATSVSSTNINKPPSKSVLSKI